MKIFYFLILAMNLCASESITESDALYRKACQKAVAEESTFKIFRSLPEYSRIVEEKAEKKFAKCLLAEASPIIRQKMESFQELDTIGSPATKDLSGLGRFSGTTLRYILIANQIEKLFSLPHELNIVEVGGGFGGQCYILSQLHPISDYVIYDLPEANDLIRKVMKTLDVSHVNCCSPDEPFHHETVDLFISNYAFSECSRKMQMDYFEKMIKRADRGYVLYNQISSAFNVDSFSPKEFMELLDKNGMHPRMLQESVMTNPGNVLITWDRTKN